MLLLAAQGAAIVSWLELWPFSPYKMFSETRRSSDALTRYRVFGIPADDPATEIRITPGVLEPLHNSSVQQPRPPGPADPGPGTVSPGSRGGAPRLLRGRPSPGHAPRAAPHRSPPLRGCLDPSGPDGAGRRAAPAPNAARGGAPGPLTGGTRALDWVRRRWNAFWFAPETGFNLAVTRIAFFGGLLAIHGLRDISVLGEADPALWYPLSVFRWLSLPRPGRRGDPGHADGLAAGAPGRRPGDPHAPGHRGRARRRCVPARSAAELRRAASGRRDARSGPVRDGDGARGRPPVDRRLAGDTPGRRGPPETLRPGRAGSTPGRSASSGCSWR